MDWDDIKLFQKVGETGSFSKAASHLNISQPTVSRRMKSFQDTLGFRLFIRNDNGLILSDKGKILYNLALDMVKNAQAFSIASNSLAQQRQIIKLACSPLIGLVLSRKVEKILEGLGSVNLAFLTSADFVDLEKNEADLAIRNQLPEKGNLLAKSIGNNHFGIYVSEQFYNTHRNQIKDNSFQELPWIGYHKNMSHLPSSRWLASCYGVTTPDVQLDSSLLILDAVVQGKGLAILPTYLETSHNLVAVKKPLSDLVFKSWLVSHQQTAHDPVLTQIKNRLEVVLKGVLNVT